MIVLDTCAIIWDALDPSKLSKRAKKAIEQADQHNALLISDISIWEIAMLIHKKRIEVESTASNLINLYLAYRNASVQSISPEIADVSVSLGKEINPDPADRIIVATSIIHNAQVVTADQNLRKSSGVNTVW